MRELVGECKGNNLVQTQKDALTIEVTGETCCGRYKREHSR